MDQEDNKLPLSPTETSNSSLEDTPSAKPPSCATDNVGANHDTVHYLSPASTTRTLCEGDFDYRNFIPFLGGTEQPAFLSESSVSCEEPKLQRTIAIIKPEAMAYKDVVLKAINDKGLVIVNQRTVHLTPEQVAEIYSRYYGCPSFPNMVISMSMEPLLVLSLAAPNAIEKWKSMVGPNNALPAEWFFPINVRQRFGLHESIPDALHASQNSKDANYEHRYFFPQTILEPIPIDEFMVEDYCKLHVNPTLLQGLVELVRKKPVDPLIFLAEWLLVNNPFQPSVPYTYAMAQT